LSEYYLRARYYDQSVGRFTQMDTWQGQNSDPATLHKYLYTYADPINNIDPSGNFSIGSFGASSSSLGILATASTQTVRTGFTFLINAAGHVVGIAATTCAASIAAIRFGISMPVAEFSGCDGSNHRGRWQAQGGGLEESEPWNQSTPLTLTQGLALLDKLEAKLRPSDRKARALYFEQARIYARRLAAGGGMSADNFRGKSFPTGVPSSHPRVDLEIRKGDAFING